MPIEEELDSVFAEIFGVTFQLKNVVRDKETHKYVME
jgi:hypothetical protein